MRSLNNDLRDARLAALLQNVIAHAHVFMQQASVFAAPGEPAAIPGAIDADA
jgi:hypothetical protein